MVAEEARIRDLVDDAAYSSGWFIGFGYCDPQPSDFRQRAKEGVTFLKKVKSFRIAAAEYFGEPDGDPAERYDLWPERRILPVIRRIERRVELQINYWEDLGRRWLDVVDGQQRLTTLTLLLSAIRANVPAKEAEKLASNAAPSADNPRSVGPGRPNSAKPRATGGWRDLC